jgi:hypothetical protein
MTIIRPTAPPIISVFDEVGGEKYVAVKNDSPPNFFTADNKWLNHQLR